jgi:hypothetical protein
MTGADVVAHPRDSRSHNAREMAVAGIAPGLVGRAASGIRLSILGRPRAVSGAVADELSSNRYSRLDKGKPSVRTGRKATGLRQEVAGPPKDAGWDRESRHWRKLVISFSRWDVRTVRIVRLALVALCAFVGWSLAGRLAAAQAATPVSCSLYASPSGSDSSGDGSQTGPFQTAQHLVSALAPGQTGCLTSGTYTSSPGLSFEHGGSAGSPITLASAPGQTATLAGGYVYVPTGSNYVTLENLNLDGSATTQVGVQIFGSEVSLIGNDITNHAQHNSCIIMGYPGYTPYPTNTLIENNVIHQCGNRADGNQDHAIYFSQSIDATVTNNVIWGTAAFALHLYPNAQGNQVTHNVIDGNGYGAIFAGADDSTSNDNNVSYNVITNSTVGMGVQQSWGGAVGQGNTFAHNCLSNNAGGNIETPDGYSAADNVTAAPDYVNAVAHSYGLTSSSPCLAVVQYAGGSPITAVAAGTTSHATAGKSRAKRHGLVKVRRTARRHGQRAGRQSTQFGVGLQTGRATL